MRPILWGDGTRWDDVNARWGSPSYVLEEGDEGYQPPAPPPTLPTPTQTKRIMSSNATPRNRTILLPLAHRIHAGQVSHGVSVGLHHHTAAIMDGKIKALEGDPGAVAGSPAEFGSQAVYKSASDATGEAEAALVTLSDGEVKTWLEGYQNVLQGLHGKKANSAWEAAGFPAGTTAIPRTHDARDTLLNAARAYLSQHPTYEASLPRKDDDPLAITAAEAQSLHEAMQAAETLITTRKQAQAAAKLVRDADVDALYDEVSATIGELRDLLSITDTRWELFGLNIPANPTVPLGVESLTLTAAGTGRLLAEWTYAVRAEYYRLFLKRLGEDEEPVNIADPKDLEYTLKNLTPGTTVEVYIVPMNEAGAGPASPTVTAVVP